MIPMVCPTCSAEMKEGRLLPRPNVGILNSLLGYSIGSSASLVWEPKRGGKSTPEIAIASGGAEAYRCPTCGTTLFRC